MVEEPIAEWIRRRMNGWPHEPQDLLMVTWPSEAPDQELILGLMLQTAMDEKKTLLERQAAWDYLLDRTHEYLVATLQTERVQFEDIPAPLVAWCMMVAIGAVNPPKRGRGRPSMLPALRARKTRAVVNELYYGPARSQQQAIEWVADATGESTDTIVSRLRRANQQPHTFADAYIDNVLEIWGEKIPNL